MGGAVVKMSVKVENWVKDLFSARTCDVTPSSFHQDVRVLYAPFSPDPEMMKACASLLSAPERKRFTRLSAEYDKDLFAQRRAFRRFCGAKALGPASHLSRIVFRETDKGRPYLSQLQNLWFSFSSCRFGFLGAWSWTHAIGVDFEDHTRHVEALDLARRFFSEAEANAVRKAEGLLRPLIFFQLWSLKEASLKSIGEGLPFGLDAFEFELKPNPYVVHAPFEWGGTAKFDVRMIEKTASRCAALAIREKLGS